MFHDGGGAKELQTKKDSGSVKADLSNVGSNACAMAVPIAISTAIKDAADHLGKTFGRDLNRKDTITEYTGAYGKARTEAQREDPAQPAAAEPEADDLPL